MNSKTIDSIKEYLDNDDWKYKFYEEDNYFSLSVGMKGVVGSVMVIIDIDQDYYNVYSILNSTVEKERMEAVAEFLHRANYGLKDGNFELDYNDGEIRYKSYVRTKDLELNASIIERSIFVGLAMIRRYGEGIIKVMLNAENPEKCVKECEGVYDAENDDA